VCIEKQKETYKKKRLRIFFFHLPFLNSFHTQRVRKPEVQTEARGKGIGALVGVMRN
jgi:hypothetical protein